MKTIKLSVLAGVSVAILTLGTILARAATTYQFTGPVEVVNHGKESPSDGPLTGMANFLIQYPPGSPDQSPGSSKTDGVSIVGKIDLPPGSPSIQISVKGATGTLSKIGHITVDKPGEFFLKGLIGGEARTHGHGHARQDYYSRTPGFVVSISSK